MDMITIEPRMLKGEVTVPPSKSVAHRVIISAALAGENCVIENVAMSKDIEATLGCMRALGTGFRKNKSKRTVTFSKKRKAKLPDEIVLDCCESGSTLRFLMPIALLTGKTVKLMGQGRLMQRPQKPYFDLFKEKGISYKQTDEYILLKGQLTAGEFCLPGDVSSQFITGLLFALPLLDGDSKIIITTETESKGYIDLTLSVLKDFGIEIKNNNYQSFEIKGGQKYLPRNYRIEGDYSQAAFFLVAGALGCDIKCKGLREDSLQGDKQIIDIIRQTGAKIINHPDGSIQAVRTDTMNGIVIDAREIPDLVPVLAVLCGFCRGESRIINAGRLRIKESDRLAAIKSELAYVGLDIEEGMDYLKIKGTNVLIGKTVSAWNDHRIAMAMAVAACRCEGEVSITGAKTAVCKSYPDFFEVYSKLQNGPEPVAEGERK